MLLDDISLPTHKNGNTLDLVITKQHSMMRQCRVDELNSDHMNILIEVNLTKIKSTGKKVNKRKVQIHEYGRLQKWPEESTTQPELE